jgi:hypothetical protein
VSHHRPAARRAAALLIILGAASGTAAIKSGANEPVAAAATKAAAVLPESLAFDVEYAGIGAEGVDQIWRGTVDGPVPGIVTIRVEYAGAPADRRMPVWPVNAWLLFSADDLRSSFAAELSGSLNWTSGELRVTGLVSDGIRRDSPVEQRVRLLRPGFAGTATVRFLPRLAAHAAANRGTTHND